MDKKTIDNFIEAFAWFSSNVYKIGFHLESNNAAVRVVVNWFDKTMSEPTNLAMVNGFVASAMVIREVLIWDPIDPWIEDEARRAIEFMFARFSYLE